MSSTPAGRMPAMTTEPSDGRPAADFRRPAANYQLTITASARFTPSMSPLLSESLGPPPTSDSVEGRLLNVLCKFLGAGLVSRPVKLNEAQRVTCIVYYYYLLMHYYYILLLVLLLLIITVFVITLLLQHYYVLLHHSLLHIITVFVITLLLHHYYVLLHLSLLHIITVFVIALLLHCYYLLLH